MEARYKTTYSHKFQATRNPARSPNAYRAHSYNPPSSGNLRFRWLTTNACGKKKNSSANIQNRRWEGPAFTAVPKKSGITTISTQAKTRSVNPSSLRSASLGDFVALDVAWISSPAAVET